MVMVGDKGPRPVHGAYRSLKPAVTNRTVKSAALGASGMHSRLSNGAGSRPHHDVIVTGQDVTVISLPFDTQA